MFTTKVANAMAAARRRGDRAEVRELRQQRRGLPARDPGDPGYRRLLYLRYADDGAPRALMGVAM